MDKHFSLLGNKVVIDCGHIIISGYDGDYSFGHDDKCSDGELMTFQEAVNVAKKLKSLDKNVLINIYLSDLSGFQRGNIGRKNLYDRVNNGDKYSFMPKEYIDLLCNTGLSESDIKINLQSMGNAKFKKKVKKTISFLEMNKKKTVHNYQKKIFSEYNSIFLTNSSHELFSLTTPWLFFYKEENAHLDGQWWLDDNIEIRDSWLKKLPLLKLKRKPFINLYESGGKVLCPATYGGLLSIYDNSFDHIAIYSRKDDKHVGEKVIKGVVATNILDDNFSRNCLQIIYSEFDEPEISFIGKNSIKEMKGLFMRLNAVNKYIFFIISSVVLQSIAYGFLSKDSYNFILFIVLQGFFLTSLFYFLIGLNKGFELKFSDVMPLLKLNISTALAFLCFYISLYFIPASISSLVEASAGPLWGVVIGLLYSNEKVSLKTLFNTVMIFLCSMVILFIDRVDGISKKDVVGVILSILAALGATLIAFGSKSSSKNTLPIISVLAFRFNLTWMISFVYLKYTHYDFFLNFKVEYIFLAFFGITLPMYFLQLGMKNVHPIVTMICLSFIPVVTYMCEFILGGGFNYAVFLLLLFSVALALLQLKSSKC